MSRTKKGQVMNNDIKLKPCPFCGGMNLYYATGRFYGVECADCGARLGGYNTEEEAAEAWNTRAEVKESDVSTQSTDADDVSKKIREIDMSNIWWR